LLGYRVIYKNLNLPFEGNDLGTLVMREMQFTLKETEISAERIPILIKKDTIEYNAQSYKTKPDAAAEELFEKTSGCTGGQGRET